ncbi:MAG TPA: MMPL family transporter [Kiloniellales bacterium]|nr:MMPL family transporter [Kiloniellales bacterium]
MTLSENLVHVVDWSRRKAWLVILAALLLTAAAGVYAKYHLGFDSNTESLLSEELPWKKRQAVMNELFPDNKHNILVVIDAATPDQAEAAAASLTAALQQQPDLFPQVRRPDGGPFFDRYGLLFLSAEALQETSDRLVAAQGMIGQLAADPSLRGLFDALSLALDGVSRGEAAAVDLEPALAVFADATEAALEGERAELSWQKLLGGSNEPRLRRFILVKPQLDFARLKRGGKASAAIRAAAEELGLTPDRGVSVRLTGDVPLADEEFATVAEGAGMTTALSLGLVTLILFAALRSWRVILPILATLVVGIIWSAAFAALTVGKLNLLSIAFAVLFIGLAVDFGIQFAVRYRDERFHDGTLPQALRRTARGVGLALLLAAGATAVDFYSFLPTDYRGISELGLVAGTSMVFGILLTFTLVPALLTVLHPPGEPESVGFAWAAPVDRGLLRRRWLVLGAFGALAAICFFAAWWLRFDYNPLSLKDPDSESMATLRDVIDDPLAMPFTIDVLAENEATATAEAERVAKLPQVGRTLTLDSFVPKDQGAKLLILDDLRFFLEPALSATPKPTPSASEELDAAKQVARKLRDYGKEQPEDSPANRLRRALKAVTEEQLPALREALIGGLPQQLDQLRMALTAEPITRAELPAELRSAWLAPDGRARIQVIPHAGVVDGPALRRFVAAVQAVEPDAAGAAVSIVESGQTMLHAFEVARTLAVVVVAALLFLVLRRPGDVLRVMLPLVLAALLTMGTMVAINLPFNFANFVALPLLVGIGVAFDIYFVLNWRAGRGRPLQSPTARAVVFSALTTAAAFGSLAVSPHPGTASLGLLLAIGLAWTLVTTLFFLPALLGRPPQPPAEALPVPSVAVPVAEEVG